MRSETFVCFTCRATKTIVAHYYQSTREFKEELPDEIPCETPGCTGMMKP